VRDPPPLPVENDTLARGSAGIGTFLSVVC
jgi:hypothetical protein